MKTYHVYRGMSFEYAMNVEDIDEGTKYTLFYSSHPSWTNPMKEIGYIVNTGNGIVLSEIFYQKKEIDYAVIEYLRILMAADSYLKNDNEPEFTFISEGDKFSI